MPLNSTISSREALPSQAICSQYLHSKVALFTAIRNTKRRIFSMALAATHGLALLTSCVLAGLLFLATHRKLLKKTHNKNSKNKRLCQWI